MEGKLFVLSGPSGVGKGSICRKLDWDQLDLHKSISMTTRAMRAEDAEGETYYFVTKDQFEDNIRQGNFLEYANFSGNYYGTPRKAVEDWLKDGHHVLLEIETNGASQIMKNFPEAVSIFILPPKAEALRDRLESRGSENEEQIEKRLQEADRELALAGAYTYTVVNDVLDDAVAQVTAIIQKESGAQ